MQGGGTYQFSGPGAGWWYWFWILDFGFSSWYWYQNEGWVSIFSKIIHTEFGSNTNILHFFLSFLIFPSILRPLSLKEMLFISQNSSLSKIIHTKLASQGPISKYQNVSVVTQELIDIPTYPNPHMTIKLSHTWPNWLRQHITSEQCPGLIRVNPLLV